jgi:hypothetical protein
MPMTDREIFDEVKNHLLKQRANSAGLGLGGCRYRSGGLKCAIGCLISDVHYDEKMEGFNLHNRVPRKAVADSLGINDDDLPIDMLLDLQKLHDEYCPEDWADKLDRIEVCYFGQSS